MATLKEVLEHLVRHSEGYATPALRQEHLDAIAGSVRVAGPGDAVSADHVHETGGDDKEES